MKVKNLKIGEVYEIYWLDTFSFNGWYDNKELKEKTKKMTYFQKSVGILAGRDKDWVILVAHKNPNREFSEWGHPNWIPIGVIKRIKKI